MKIVLLPVLLLGFFLIHLIKMMRMYLILMDRNISFERFVPAYLRTTLVNLIIPFKLGEIYRVGVFYRITGGFKTGFFSVLIDRFFDTLAIVLILLPYQILVSGHVTLPVILLTAFLIVVVFAYGIFLSTYKFLNRYIITSRTSKRSMAALKGLERLYEWYDYVKRLVRGRYGILILMSLAAWLCEVLVLVGFAHLMGQGFTVADFGNYIESIISGSTYELKRLYTMASIAVMLAATIISTGYYLLVQKRKAE